MTSDNDAAARKEEEEKETFVEDSSHKWNTFKERKVKRTKGVWKRKAQTGGAGCKSRTKSIDRRSRYSYYQRLTRLLSVCTTTACGWFVPWWYRCAKVCEALPKRCREIELGGGGRERERERQSDRATE